MDKFAQKNIKHHIAQDIIIGLSCATWQIRHFAQDNIFANELGLVGLWTNDRFTPLAWHLNYY